LSALLLLGCASTTGPIAYPSTWAPLDKTQIANGCPAISGTYSNHASDGLPAETSSFPTLTNIFDGMAHGPGEYNPAATGHTWSVPNDAKSVTFQLAPERLEVTFTGANGATSNLSFRRYHPSWDEKRYDDLFTCYTNEDGPRLRFFAEPERHSREIRYIFVETGGTLVFLLKAKDGSLIVQWRSETLGIYTELMVTRMKYNSVWWRYPLVSGLQ
jgi:hypothetical protein